MESSMATGVPFQAQSSTYTRTRFGLPCATALKAANAPHSAHKASCLNTFVITALDISYPSNLRFSLPLPAREIWLFSLHRDSSLTGSRAVTTRNFENGRSDGHAYHEEAPATSSRLTSCGPWRYLQGPVRQTESPSCPTVAPSPSASPRASSAGKLQPRLECSQIEQLEISGSAARLAARCRVEVYTPRGKRQIRRTR